MMQGKSLDPAGRTLRPDLYVSTEDNRIHTRKAWHRTISIDETDWIPSTVAAHVLGISKQAIHDRIKRGTLEFLEDERTGHYVHGGQKVMLVQLLQVRSRNKAGRPQGSTNKKTIVSYNPNHYQCCGGTCCKNCIQFTRTDDMGGRCKHVPSARCMNYNSCPSFAATQAARTTRQEWSKNHVYRPEIQKGYILEEPWECEHCRFKNPSGYFCTKCDGSRDGVMQEYLEIYRPEMKNKFIDH